MRLLVKYADGNSVSEKYFNNVERFSITTSTKMKYKKSKKRYEDINIKKDISNRVLHIINSNGKLYDMDFEKITALDIKEW